MINEYSSSVDVATVFLKSLMDKNVTQISKDSNQYQIFQFLAFHASLFGFMALKFRQNFIDTAKDKDPSVAKTVRRVITCMKEMFFDQSHENIRNACFITFFEILENCFVNKRYGRENKKAKDLIIQPLFDELQSPKERVSRQTACYILRKLNEKYMQDPEIVNVFHCHTMVALGIKHKVYDGEFLMAVVDLLNEHGVGITLGECLAKAVPHFIASIKYNQTG